VAFHERLCSLQEQLLSVRVIGVRRDHPQIRQGHRRSARPTSRVKAKAQQRLEVKQAQQYKVKSQCLVDHVNHPSALQSFPLPLALPPPPKKKEVHWRVVLVKLKAKINSLASIFVECTQVSAETDCQAKTDYTV
jgi:hypothetical protein